MGELQAEWLRLVGEALPDAARDHSDWPIRLDHCFMRVILDAVCCRPWRAALAPPAYRHMDTAQLKAAIALANDILVGRADLAALNRQSLRWRGKLRD